MEAVRDAERRGELLEAYDLAQRGLEQHPRQAELRYLAVLALARAGATAQAARQFAELDLNAVPGEDAAALEARITKDQALAASGEERSSLAGRAAEQYWAVREQTGGYFPAINAATMTLVAGDPEGARQRATDALELVGRHGDGGYWCAATEAEARLLLGDTAGARAALERAATLHGGDFGALSTTRRQLRLVCGAMGVDAGLLESLAGPAVAHFCGHRISPPGVGARFIADEERAVTGRMADALDRHPVDFAYGSLASGGDILWAELLLDRGSELHVVLPFATDDFLAVSVASSGPEWVRRFERCLEAAHRVTFATSDAYLGDDALFAYCSELAMGLALLRARYLDAPALQFALWDGLAADDVAGTGADVQRWQATGHEVIVVGPGQGGSPSGAGPEAGGPATVGTRRVIRSMLFGDASGFAGLTDKQVRSFASSVLGAMAAALAPWDDDIEYCNTWGDALFVVLSTTPSAARCALDLQDALGAVDRDAAGLPPELAMRVSGHVGPVIPVFDPVVGKPGFMGSHVNRAARIEPVTPPGAVYVTEAFAAALELAGCPDVGCDYVGRLPAAKDYGRLRMYRLRRHNPVP